MTLTPELNAGFAVAFLVLLVAFLVLELWGVTRKGKGDTLTESWRWVEHKLGPWGSWVFRVATGGILIWALLHFLVGAD